MASLVLTSVGASLGNALLPGLGGRLVGKIGQRYGKILDEAWGWSSSSAGSSKLESFKVQDSSYGEPIPVVFGQSRVAGNVIWVSDLIETVRKNASSGKGGILSSTSTTYTYSLNCAVALCAGEIGSIQTIWADTKIIYQDGVWRSGVVESATFYTGADNQAVDPLLESWIGEGLVPAYRGMAYVVLEGLQLSNFSNRLPNLTFEVLPQEATGEPAWLGTVDPNISFAIAVNRNQGMPPLTIDGGALSARRVIAGGYSVSSNKASFYVIEYDVTGEEPVEIVRTQSGAFSGVDVGGHSWAMASDGRFVAMGLQDGASGNPYAVVIYDTQARAFGTPLSIPMALAEARQIAWIDAQRFVVMGYENGKRGVHVLMRAGLSVIDLGFFDVWGAGTQVSRVPEMYAQFVPYGGGVLHFVVDKSPAFTLIEARFLSWSGNSLVVGNKITLASGLSTGTGNGGQAYLFRSSEEEVTLFYGTTIDMRLLSFSLGQTNLSITRPWQVLTNTTISVAQCHAPTLIGNRLVIVQRASTENAYRLSEISLDDGNFSLQKNGVLLENFEDVGLNFGAVALSGARLLLSVNSGTAGALGRLDILKRRNTGSTLDQVVATILTRAGYQSGDYDVTALSACEIDGYVLSEQATGASALEPLQILQPFDLVEKDGQIKAVLHGAGDAVEIPSSEAGANGEESNQTFVPLLSETRAPETALPLEVRLSYEDAARDYETGTQTARRGVTKGARSIEKIALNLVLTTDRAKRVTQDRLFDMWRARTSYALTLSRSWVPLTLGDIVTMGSSRMRLTKIELENGVVTAKAVSCPASAVSSEASADSSATTASHHSVPSSAFFPMDIPLLRNEDDGPGFYAAVSGIDGWSGASLWRSTDDVNFTESGTFATAAVAGYAVAALASRSVFYMDRVSTLQVQLLQGELSTCTQEALFNGSNAALVGGEIVQFQTAVLLGPGLYQLSNFLRGRQGTEKQTGTHAIGESFVLLSSASVQFMPLQLSDRGSAYHFRAVSNGGSLDLAQDLTVTCSLATLAPFAPAHLKGVRKASGDVALSWVRRARKNAAWVDYIDAPLDETTELYDLEIVNLSSGVVLRTVSDLTTTSYTYAESLLVADFGSSLPSSLGVNVYQKSVRYGRGTQATTTVSL